MNWPEDFINSVVCMDVREALSSIPDEVVQTVVTSPPYWSLRDYQLEPVIFGGDNGCLHEWGSVDRREGAAGKRRWQHGKDDGAISRSQNPEGWESIAQGNFCSLCSAWRGSLGLEPTPELFVEHLVEIFREVKRVLKKDGTLWLNLGDSFSGGGRGGDPKHSKGDNSAAATMESYKGIPAKNLLGIPWRVAFALQADGWYLRSDIIWNKPNPMPESVTDRPTKSHEYLFLLSKNATYFYDQDAVKEPVTGNAHPRGQGVTPKSANVDRGTGIKANRDFHRNVRELVGSRNKRSVWTIPTQPSSLPHFAQFPEKLVEPCVMAGSKAGDIVLDPFGGTGTVGLVAKHHGRHYISIDLSPEYSAIAEDRLRQRELELQTQTGDDE